MIASGGMLDFLAVEAGLLFGGGDLDWLVDQPRADRVRIFGYMHARKDERMGLLSVAGVQATDLIHFGNRWRGTTNNDGDEESSGMIDGALGQLEDD